MSSLLLEYGPINEATGEVIERLPLGNLELGQKRSNLVHHRSKFPQPIEIEYGTDGTGRVYRGTDVYSALRGLPIEDCQPKLEKSIPLGSSYNRPYNIRTPEGRVLIGSLIITHLEG